MDGELARLKEMIVWWERKRLIYNVLITAFSIFCLYSFWDYPMRKIIGDQQVIINTIAFIFGANLLYTFSWVSGVINYFFLNKNYISSKRRRWTFFTIGTVFSLFLLQMHFVIEFDILFAK
jgi:hypothetical protein